MNLEIKNLPAEVWKLLNVFGSDARLVGGCVRDLLLQKKVSDFDFATRFLPQKTIEILQKNKIKALETGIKYGTVTAVLNGKNFEITTLRQDENQRGRDTDVKFTDDYLIDASRRDFTINALYLDDKGKIYDYFNGISDLKNGDVKFIGNSNERISEDFLRILRFFRFTAKYAKGIDELGLKACISHKSNLKKLSKERIRQEFYKIFQTENSEKLLQVLTLMKKENILSEIFSSTFDIQALERVIKINPDCDFELKIAVFLLSKKSDVKNISSEICATNKEKKFFDLIFSIAPDFDLKALRRLLVSYEKEFVIKFYLFYLAKNRNEEVKYLEFLREFELPEFPFSAQDLINAGFEGKEIGDNLLNLKILWADSDFTINRNAILNYAKKNNPKN